MSASTKVAESPKETKKTVSFMAGFPDVLETYLSRKNSVSGNTDKDLFNVFERKLKSGKPFKCKINTSISDLIAYMKFAKEKGFKIIIYYVFVTYSEWIKFSMKQNVDNFKDLYSTYSNNLSSFWEIVKLVDKCIVCYKKEESYKPVAILSRKNKGFFYYNRSMFEEFLSQVSNAENNIFSALPKQHQR